MAKLTDSWELAGITVPNRVLLAPLAGIGNWFVRLQAHRHGAGMAFSEMVSSHAIHHGNEKTCNELLRLHPDEGTVSLQLFGQDPEIMFSAAKHVAENTTANMIDLNMGCPVPKVCKTGAGAALLKDPETAIEVTRAAREGSGLPVTVKIRSGSTQGDTSGFELAHRLVAEGGAAAITFHPRAASVHHKGVPDYDLAKSLAETLDAPMILTGGLRTAEQVKRAFDQVQPAAVMLARGSLGNPWLFDQLLDGRTEEAHRDEVLSELDWVMNCAEDHLGEQRAARYLRKFYPWYVQRLQGDRQLQDALARTDSLVAAREILGVEKIPAAA